MICRRLAHPCLQIIIQTCLFLCAVAVAGENLLKNPGFEEELEPAWEKRTPEDAKRKLYRGSEVAHSGRWCAVLENIEPEYTRLRQGSDGSLVVAPGSLAELTVWVKSDLSEDGAVIVQLYCMGEKNKITGTFTARTIGGKAEWTPARCLAQIPSGTTYCMAYLQIKDGIGRAFFDDVELRVLRGPRPRTPPPKIALVTDLSEDDPCLQNLKVLLEDGLVPFGGELPEERLADCAGAAVLVGSGQVPKPTLDSILRFAEQGRPVFMDIRNFAQWKGLETIAATMKADPKTSVEDRMALGLRVVKESEATRGFKSGQVIPRAGADGELFVLAKDALMPDAEVLAVAPGGEAGLVRAPIGKGVIVAADVLSLREPLYRNVDAYYKYLFLTNTLTNRVQFGEYYEKRYPYAEFVELMKQAAAQSPEIRFREEGPACGDYKIYSLNLGREGAPLYFLYGATHGSEWEPAYGLLTFARRVAEGRMSDVIDLEKAAIKIVPILNPSGYDQFTRKNANGVDLNRQGDYCWEKYQGSAGKKSGKYDSDSSHWKGSAPFCEPEAKTYKRICQAENLYCILDYHGNTSATSNKVGVLPATAREGNELRAFDLQYYVNERLRGRFILKQQQEETFSQYLLDRVRMGAAAPFLMNTSARGRYGMLVELTAGYRSSYGTVLQTDVTCEVCRALFKAYPPP